jgi:hypothetical protein
MTAALGNGSDNKHETKYLTSISSTATTHTMSLGGKHGAGKHSTHCRMEPEEKDTDNQLFLARTEK